MIYDAALNLLASCVLDDPIGVAAGERRRQVYTCNNATAPLGVFKDDDVHDHDA
jgi:hypothetical protein